MPKRKTNSTRPAPSAPSGHLPLFPEEKGGGRVGAGANTKASLSSLIKSSRDIMRKDAGLNGDLDRLPQLSWILFLKCYDDLEIRREADAVATRQKYKPAIPSLYRWRDWASNENEGATGEDLIKFINDGLLPALRALTGSDERLKVAEVFKETYNRMLSGYLLRDVVNLVDGIHFQSKDEIFTLAHLYESMLKEMRDAAGDSGEFYTPRPVVKLIVDRVKPRLGETVLDPACGTGGFLVEAYEYLKPLAKNSKDQIKLQSETLFGVEKKPLPYLLGTMNLLLHGLEAPNIRRDNALKNPLNEIGEKDRFNVIVTNPPFGGEEEAGIQLNFPEATRTSETALLFVQFIMRSLKRQKASEPSFGRAAIIVPDGVLSQTGIGSIIRAQLIQNFNLHTIIRLPKGVFEPYTKISSNILFFDAVPPVNNFVWYYEVPVRSGLKAYSRNKAINFNDFKTCIEWWENRVETQYSWKVTHEQIEHNQYRLDFKNPNYATDYKYDEPHTLIDNIETSIRSIQQANKLFSDISSKFADKRNETWEVVEFGDLAKPLERAESVVDDKEYPVLAMSWYAKGLYVKYIKRGADIKANKVFRVEKGDFVYNRLFAWKGSFAEAQDEDHGCYVSNEFPLFKITDDRVAPGFLWSYFAQPSIWEMIERLSTGTTSTSRLRLKEDKLQKFLIPLPPIEIQQDIALLWHRTLSLEKELGELENKATNLYPAILERVTPVILPKV